MKRTSTLGIWVLGLASLGACGGDDEPALTPCTGPNNGCDASCASDRTSEKTSFVTFGADNQGLDAYAPTCLRIKKGHDVTFQGDFATHPLFAGKVEGGTATPDGASPIKPTLSGGSVTFNFPEEGTFPYYCGEHFKDEAMIGAIFVVP